jgi:hypothetical protein
VDFTVKTLRRLLFGLLSSLFLAVGLVRAASTLDPVKSARPPSPTEVRGFTVPCMLPCDFPTPKQF